MWWLNVLRVQVYASVIAVPLWRKKGSVLEDARQQFEAKRMNQKSLPLFVRPFNTVQDLKELSGRVFRNFLTALEYKHYGQHLFYIHISMPGYLLLPMAENILISRFFWIFIGKYETILFIADSTVGVPPKKSCNRKVHSQFYRVHVIGRINHLIKIDWLHGIGPFILLPSAWIFKCNKSILPVWLHRRLLSIPIEYE